MTLAIDEPRLQSYAPLLLAALLVASAFVATIGGWALFARLDAAVVAQGTLHADSERKSVEHLEGGILSELLVRAGDRVAGGQVVARLDATQIRETLSQIAAELDQARFAAWRLEAERAGRRPDAASRPEGAQAEMRGAVELALYDARLGTHRSRIAALERQIDQSRSQIAASEARAAAAASQSRLWTEERAQTETLVERGAVPRQKLYELDRALAQFGGERGEHEALAAAARQDIARARAEIAALEEERRVEIVTNLVETRKRIETLSSQERTARDVLRRQDLRAPQAGRVVEITTVTPGAVIAPGEPLMTILPENDELVALAQLHPSAIDSVQIGVPAQVRFVAAKKAGSPIVPGTVSYVSADALTDDAGETYFEARVALDPEAVAALDDVVPLAGMPVEVSLTIGERRAGTYLVEPLLRRIGRAMREE
ncbi:HlyD family secretion protein [Palleronia aestuarii]|uniref:Membrane fusion protein (MFP) family protein n=1 Tax=Palleronia aestuarii TaxID=568105 RepID=A0A2W7P102_9RHOB|nr:HlyD family type I secretion periplasmic adaptor subunit [Palleronia aestuarii]PZX17132.1 HlyD family secretion protein [Palleronia aestuarii]